jgi:hypothetical protein
VERERPIDAIAMLIDPADRVVLRPGGAGAARAEVPGAGPPGDVASRTMRLVVRGVHAVASALVLTALVSAGPAFARTGRPDATGSPLPATTQPAATGSPVPATTRPPAAAGPSDCTKPTVPGWFHDDLVTAIGISKDLDPNWAASPYIARIVCWQGSNFDVSFAPPGDAYHAFHGIFAMTLQELAEIAGPWHLKDRYAFKLTAKCFVSGWSKCARTTANSKIVQQDIAGLRWMWLAYGNPKAAWNHILRTFRFSSFPRPGTDDTVTKHPLGRCPVDGSVSYRDDFGEPRYVGGYHPHWGNDMHAPIGRPIRAPFGGLAVAHSDNWFAGKYVSVIGAKGFVHNGHLSRFGTLGYVKAGTIIGYVGQTGDAAGPHDHFEWHPWVVPTPLHVAPSGFERAMDAIDPFPFLNQVC